MAACRQRSAQSTLPWERSFKAVLSLSGRHLVRLAGGRRMAGLRSKKHLQSRSSNSLSGSPLAGGNNIVEALLDNERNYAEEFGSGRGSILSRLDRIGSSAVRQPRLDVRTSFDGPTD